MIKGHIELLEKTRNKIDICLKKCDWVYKNLNNNTCLSDEMRNKYKTVIPRRIDELCNNKTSVKKDLINLKRILVERRFYDERFIAEILKQLPVIKQVLKECDALITELDNIEKLLKY